MPLDLSFLAEWKLYLHAMCVDVSWRRALHEN
jgi:hypothetical protein